MKSRCDLWLERLDVHVASNHTYSIMFSLEFTVDLQHSARHPPF